MIRWRSTDACPFPVAVECKQIGYPHADADGTTQHTNTHFDTEDEAWESCRRSAEAFVRLAAGEVKSAERDLEEAREQSAEAVKFMSEYIEARREYERERWEREHREDP